ncbi:MAG: cytochrome c family protein [candidate division KSB1 bacterium]|nr:cytochrome c family protein [candidate division KSB1 bacterium]MDZ7274983.1 cytochrome c family protein [candidate division KSB1 bacterium]MDZ7286566.1 cytochrome c family protein [candidate division KSB1 bacterium]MDZ7299270.1 cytochrome c family protein [candidate division KSB1 bacterium]MDZ7306070.1 cytochrome c family protein [candidate division KSB1 bacterium]
MAKAEGNKGFFGTVKLSLAQRYILPQARRLLVGLGGLGGLGVLVCYAVDALLLQNQFIASGPVSSGHAKFETDCRACHEPFQSARNAKCSVCHEKTGDTLGVYSFAAHVLYRSADARRLTAETRDQECALCHQEHDGRAARLTEVSDARCLPCHAFGSLNRHHPQFDFITQQTPDDSTLRFTHLRHVAEVAKREQLTDRERACLYCHNPRPDGRHFEPIAFDTHCSACHLKPNSESAALPIRMPGDTAPGVELLEDLRRRGGPARAALQNISPAEFQIKPGNRVVKSPLRHADPWILENLRTLRRMLYPENGLTDLLRAGSPATASAPALQPVYEEALQTLRRQAEALRARPEPEMQRELARVDSLLRVAQNKIRRQDFAVQDARLFQAAAKADPRVSPAQAEAILGLVDNLTRRCQRCHVVANAAIQRVQKDQRILWRAEFDHRAHILQRRCLECHTAIPMLEPAAAAAPPADHAAIQNVPGIDNCRGCHNAVETSNRCITCHDYHPNKSNRASMLLYVD